MTAPAAPVSSVPAFRSWLFDTLVAATAKFNNPGVDVYLGQPSHESANDQIVISSVHRQTPTQRLIGSGGPIWQDEIYTVEVIIEAFVAGPNAFPDVENRAYAILAACEIAVRADPSGGSTVVVCHPDSSESEHDWVDVVSGGSVGHCVITWNVAATATW